MSLKLEVGAQLLVHHGMIDMPSCSTTMGPAITPEVSYYSSKRAADHLCFMYRVLECGISRRNCIPEAQGWPEITLSAEKLDRHFVRLNDDLLYCSQYVPNRRGSPAELDCSGEMFFPSLRDLKTWCQVGSGVCFDYCDVRSSGVVVGHFVWRSDEPFSKDSPNKKLALVLLLKTPTNKLLLSCEVTDLHIEDIKDTNHRGQVYIQGISLLSIVATLIANVTYLAMLDPPKGNEASFQGDAVTNYPEATSGSITAETVFIICNSIAFYSSVLAVVVMTAFVPIFGTGNHWQGIFVSGLMPVVFSLVSFYIAFITCAWLKMEADMLGKPLAVTIIGVAMVIYVRIWAVQLMAGHVSKDLEISSQMSTWDWYVNRTNKHTTAKAYLMKRIQFFTRNFKESVFTDQRSLLSMIPSLPSMLMAARKEEQTAFLLDDSAEMHSPRLPHRA